VTSPSVEFFECVRVALGVAVEVIFENISQRLNEISTSENKLTQAKAGEQMGVSRREVSRLSKGKFPGIFRRAPDGISDRV
jgi:predicted XRE-type DNA-binding protein